MATAAFDPSGPSSFDGIFGLPHSPDEAAVVLIPIPWEPTTSYRKGTAQGPANIRKASQQVDLFDLDTGKPYDRGIAMLDEDADIAAWNARATELARDIIARGGADGDPELESAQRQVNSLSAALNDRITKLSDKYLAEGKLVGAVGGDHASPFGLIRAIAAKHPGVGILHVDAHADLRDAYEGFDDSHASIMHNVLERLPEVSKIVQVGLRDLSEEEHARIVSSPRLAAYFDTDLAKRTMGGESFLSIAKAIANDLPEKVYVSFDIDGLDPELCPTTGTPVPGGLSFREAVALLRAVSESGRTIVGFDLNEVGPGEWDGIVGARMLYKLIGFALLGR